MLAHVDRSDNYLAISFLFSYQFANRLLVTDVQLPERLLTRP